MTAAPSQSPPKSAPLKSSPPFLKGLRDVAQNYDGFILDLWGVVHDGIAPFPTTIPALQAMRAQGSAIWLLSNAPRRAHLVVEHLAALGVPRDLYDGIMTSGEASHVALRDIYLEKWGRRCFHIGTARDQSLFEGLDITLCKTEQDADFLLATGNLDGDGDGDEEDFMPLLRRAFAAHLPMLCANPDKVVHVGDQMVLCPGTLAAVYEELGGEVVYFGKPYPDVYAHCLAAMPQRKILAVGDGMPTDIAGAAGAGIDSALVVSGIHRANFLADVSGPEDENHLQAFWNGYGVQPQYLLRQFSW